MMTKLFKLFQISVSHFLAKLITIYELFNRFVTLSLNIYGKNRSREIKLKRNFILYTIYRNKITLSKILFKLFVIHFKLFYITKKINIKTTGSKSYIQFYELYSN